jgi:hypothetical protein
MEKGVYAELPKINVKYAFYSKIILGYTKYVKLAFKYFPPFRPTLAMVADKK